MGLRISLLALVAALTVGVLPVQAAQKAEMSEEKKISAAYVKGMDQVNARQWNAGIETLTGVIDNPKTSKDLQANALANRGAAYANKKNYDLAMNDFNKALEIKPDLTNAYYERARLYAMLGKHAEAVQDLDKVIGMAQPSSITAGYYYNRGISLMGMSPPQPEKAKSDFAMAKKLNPKLKIPVKYKDL
ncbi:MAG: tetratricopeptide repeat protein [Acidobacteriota bacterium]